MVANTLGARIKYLIDSQDLTLEKLSSYTKLSVPALSEYINNKKEPSATRLYAIAKYFNVSMEWLITGENKKEERRSDYIKNGMGEIIYKAAQMKNDDRKKLIVIMDTCFLKEEKIKAKTK